MLRISWWFLLHAQDILVSGPFFNVSMWDFFASVYTPQEVSQPMTIIRPTLNLCLQKAPKILRSKMSSESFNCKCVVLYLLSYHDLGQWVSQSLFPLALLEILSKETVFKDF